jgi:two-component system aerobic respiration control sensor histidine kinase ArcB
MNDKVKVLLVEDQLLMQFAAKKCFMKTNCEIDIASTGEKAIELTSKNNYDIIFMDIGLDDMDGYEVTQKIREESSLNAITPVIALTAHTKDKYHEKAKIAQMNGFISKPITPEMVEEMFEKHVKK